MASGSSAAPADPTADGRLNPALPAAGSSLGGASGSHPGASGSGAGGTGGAGGAGVGSTQGASGSHPGASGVGGGGSSGIRGPSVGNGGSGGGGGGRQFKKRAATSKYDLVKIKVWLGEEMDHYYVLSRFLICRMLTVTRIPASKAIKIALDVKKHFVDLNQLEIKQAEFEGVLFSLLRGRGFGDAHVNCYRMVTHFYRLRQPIVIVICGAPWTGKSTIAQALAARLNMPNVLQTDVVHELLRLSRDAPLHAVPLCLRKPALAGASQVVQEFQRECLIMRRALDGDLAKTLSDGKPLIVEGLHLDPGLLLADFADLGLLLLPANPGDLGLALQPHPPEASPPGPGPAAMSRAASSTLATAAAAAANGGGGLDSRVLGSPPGGGPAHHHSHHLAAGSADELGGPGSAPGLPPWRYSPAQPAGGRAAALHDLRGADLGLLPPFHVADSPPVAAPPPWPLGFDSEPDDAGGRPPAVRPPPLRMRHTAPSPPLGNSPPSHPPTLLSSSPHGSFKGASSPLPRACEPVDLVVLTRHSSTHSQRGLDIGPFPTSGGGNGGGGGSGGGGKGVSGGGAAAGGAIGTSSAAAPVPPPPAAALAQHLSPPSLPAVITPQEPGGDAASPSAGRTAGQGVGGTAGHDASRTAAAAGRGGTAALNVPSGSPTVHQPAHAHQHTSDTPAVSASHSAPQRPPAHWPGSPRTPTAAEAAAPAPDAFAAGAAGSPFLPSSPAPAAASAARVAAAAAAAGDVLGQLPTAGAAQLLRNAHRRSQSEAALDHPHHHPPAASGDWLIPRGGPSPSSPLNDPCSSAVAVANDAEQLRPDNAAVSGDGSGGGGVGGTGTPGDAARPPKAALRVGDLRVPQPRLCGSASGPHPVRTRGRGDGTGGRGGSSDLRDMSGTLLDLQGLDQSLLEMLRGTQPRMLSVRTSSLPSGAPPPEDAAAGAPPSPSPPPLLGPRGDAGGVTPAGADGVAGSDVGGTASASGRGGGSHSPTSHPEEAPLTPQQQFLARVAHPTQPGLKPLFVPVVLHMWERDHRLVAGDHLRDHSAPADAAAASEGLEDALRQARVVQEYLCAYAHQGVPVVQVRYGHFTQALDQLHDYVLQCIQVAMHWILQIDEQALAMAGARAQQQQQQ